MSLEEVFRYVGNLVRKEVLLHVTTSGEGPLTDMALVGTLFGVTAIVNFESAATGERLQADVARRVRL